MTDSAPVSWTEQELRLAVLKILLDCKKRQRNLKKPGHIKIVMDCLSSEDKESIEFTFWYLTEKGYISEDTDFYSITESGENFIVLELSKFGYFEP